MTVPLVDSFGRVHDRFRISVTDRCNLRCFYCMPATGAVFQPKAELLTFEEITRIATVAVTRCGVKKIRLTGGEPLVRADLPSLVKQIHSIDGVADIGLTTNAVLLSEQAESLKAAGVTHLNISLDALEPEIFTEMTRRDDFDRVMAGIEAAREVGFDVIKLNAVSVRGLTESQVVPFGKFARETGLEVRFIEYMPLDSDAAWERERVLYGHEIVELLEDTFGRLEPVPTRGAAPAQQYRFSDGQGLVGVIPSVSKPFCDHCNRFRMTATGQLLACLFSLEETDVRSLIRGSGSDADVEAAIRSCIAGKWSGHRINLETFVQPNRPMHAIGG